MNTIKISEDIVLKSPLLDPKTLPGKHEFRTALVHTKIDAEHNDGKEVFIQNQIGENDARDATIETIIELFLTGSASGLTFSPDSSTRQTEVRRLLRWFTTKLFTNVNDQNRRAAFIRHTDSFTTATILPPGIIKSFIITIFDFKNRIVTNATNEYTTWLNTKINATWAIKEFDADALPLLTKYWNATPSPPSPVNPRQYWSAAFISWIMKAAGASDLFTYSGAHITYIKAARLNRRNGVQNPFWLYRISEFIARMQPGDLLCKARAGSGLTYDNVLTHTSTSAHVDIIMEIDRPNNRIRVVGGNVCDNVDHKILTIVGNRIINSDREEYFSGIGIGTV